MKNAQEKINWTLAPLPCAGTKKQHFSLAALRRLSPHELPVDDIGYLAPSAICPDWPKGGRHFSLSFVFGGRGSCQIFGKTWPVIPPCVFTAWPGQPMKFGPDPGNTWEEFYICYAPDLLPILKRRQLANSNWPIWPVYNPMESRHALVELCQLLEHLQDYGQVDRIDRRCDAVLTDTLIAREAKRMPDDDEKAIRNIEIYIAAHLDEKLDFDRLARQHGLSPSHFRRLWRNFFNLPPAQYAMDRRMREACRLLTESDMRINEVAARLGFTDPLYFSKQFHRFIGQTASEYRGR